MSAFSAPLRGIVVGLGAMGSLHLRVLRSLPDVEVVAAVDPDEARRAAADVPVEADFAEAIELHRPDFACIAVPIGLLPSVATTALEADVHVLVEKPTAPTEAEGLAMVHLARERGLRLAVGHIERCNPAVVALKERLEQGTIGRVVQMHARRLSPFPNRISQHGVALDLSTHDIDVMRYLTGSEVDRVTAELGSPLGGPREDLLNATLRFADGATGVLETNWITPTKIRQLSVTGEHGMFVLDYLTQDLFLYEHPTKATEWDALAGMRGGGEGDMTRFALQRREPLRVEWEGFLDAVRDGGEPLVGGEDGLAALSIGLAIQQAGETHRAVRPAYREVAA